MSFNHSQCDEDYYVKNTRDIHNINIPAVAGIVLLVLSFLLALIAWLATNAFGIPQLNWIVAIGVFMGGSSFSAILLAIGAIVKRQNILMDMVLTIFKDELI